jgi:hypothetical protein
MAPLLFDLLLFELLLFQLWERCVLLFEPPLFQSPREWEPPSPRQAKM